MNPGEKMNTTISLQRNRATVFMVDDDPLAIEVLAEALGSEFDIRFAINGAQALQLLEQGTPPELILLDMVLPDTDGYALYAAIKARPQTRDVPVVFVTSMRDVASETRGLELGAVDYITKPISPPIVRARVRNHIELARTRNALSDSRNEALAAANAKAAFLATMSHEIRTPLNGVIGMTSLLQGTVLDRQQREFVDTIRLSGEALLTLLNDILDFSKIDSGRMDLAAEPLSVRGLVEDAYDILAGKAREKNLELVSWIGPGVPAAIHGDAIRLRQILINLVGNAVKFTERGEICTEVRWLPAATGDAAGGLEFRVSDTGIGIASSRTGALFEAFTQADSSTTRRYGGTGLGLAICKRLVLAMDGSIGVDSKEGIGSTFYFNVPARAAPESGLPLLQVARAALHGRRILVAQSNVHNRRYLKHELEDWGLSVVMADSGQMALEVLLAQGGFDLALIDRQLSDMNGKALAQRIRADAGHRELPLIDLTMAYDAGEADDALYRARLRKPLRQAQLHSALKTALGGDPLRQTGVLAVAAPATTLATQFPLQVLIVDDNAVNRTVAELTLARLGYRPAVAEDGRQAVEQVAQARAAGRGFDVIFMDVQMPVMDGLEATRVIKSDGGDGAPVIIAMTAAATVDDRNNCFFAGMDDFVSKPINLKEFQATIERWGSRLLRKRTLPAD